MISNILPAYTSSPKNMFRNWKRNCSSCSMSWKRLLWEGDLKQAEAVGDAQITYISIYISNINFEATYSYVASSVYHISLVRVFAINSFATYDEQVFNSVKEWIHSLKKFSTLISQSGEMQRIRFFKTQREIVEGLCI